MADQLVNQTIITATLMLSYRFIIYYQVSIGEQFCIRNSHMFRNVDDRIFKHAYLLIYIKISVDTLLTS